ncbi:hypothetical protein GGI21_001367 [Coemansia aciculifera]|nr:hypothetical protein GGI21_001367 [Coemansia aciculifera]
MYSVPFTVPASSTEFEFNSSSAELRRLSAGVDPSTIARHSAGTATNTAAASFEASRQQQIPPQLSHSHSFGQPQFPSTTSLSALAAPAHQMHLQNRLYSSDCAPESSLPSLATPASMQHPTMSAAVTAPVQLWMGDIEPWMDEDYIRLLWARMGEVVSVKPIRDRQTGAMANYCFLEFATHADAERFLALYNGKPLPDPSERLFRLNWATGMAAGFGSPGMPLGIGYSQPPSFAAPSLDSPGGMAVSGSNLGSVYPSALSLSASLDGPEYSLFVGDLAPEVTDVQLAHEFRSRYASVRTAKIVTDPVTLLSRGYGFVRFADEADQQSALAEMQSQVIGSRAIRVSTATPKRTPTMTSFQHQQQQYQAVDGALGRDGAGSPVPSESSSDSNALYNPATDPNNTTVFVGGLTHPVSEEELHNFFATYGDVVYCKIPPNRGCGFVTFSKRGPAETAMRSLNGHVLGGARVRLSWGRSQSHAQAVDEMPSHSATPAAYSASLSGHPTANNPHQMFTGYSMTPQQAFYTLSPIHPGGGSANEHPVQFGGYAQQQQQPPHFYYHHQQPQDQSMLATPVTAQGAMDLSPSVAAHFGRQSHGLAMRASGQFESMQSLQQGAYGPQHDFRGGGGGGDAIGTILPSLAGCPSELLTRRLSALALGSGHSPSASSISASSAMAPMPTLNRRPSAGVIGQRRLSSKSSFYVPPHKSSSQSSMAQMWPSSIEHSLTMPLPPQSSEVSTAASSARLSSSSLSYMAMTMTPSTLNSGDSRRQSSDDKHKRDSQDQLSLALDGDTIRAI